MIMTSFQKLKFFYKSTYSDGFPDLSKTNFKLWFFICIVSTGGLIWQIQERLDNFFQYNIVTTVRKKPLESENGVLLPKVTVCPYNRFQEDFYGTWKEVQELTDEITLTYGFQSNWLTMPGGTSGYSVFIDINKDCFTNECQCDFNPYNRLPQCTGNDRGCAWIVNNNLNRTVNGYECQQWKLPEELYVHKPNVFIREWVNSNTISHNRCSNPDQEILGPWCYTTDPNKRWEYCGICDVDMTSPLEFKQGDASWIQFMIDRWKLTSNKGNLKFFSENVDKIFETNKSYFLIFPIGVD